MSLFTFYLILTGKAPSPDVTMIASEILGRRLPNVKLNIGKSKEFDNGLVLYYFQKS